MARKKRPAQKSAKPANWYFIVEGCTEENYLNNLKKLYKGGQAVKNCKGGNAKTVFGQAKSLMNKYAADDLYLGFIIWFDEDGYFPDKQDSEDAKLKDELEKCPETKIFISRPCIEHWLLAHFQKINLDSTRKCYDYIKELQKHISHYQKNDCALLEKHITQPAIETAIQNYPELGKLVTEYFQ